MNKYAEYVRGKIDERTLFEALAEEAAELSQASLKFIRASAMNNNWTPVTAFDAAVNIKEEVMDMLSIVYMLDGSIPSQKEVDEYSKWKRWAKRMGYKEND